MRKRLLIVVNDTAKKKKKFPEKESHDDKMTSIYS